MTARFAALLLAACTLPALAQTAAPPLSLAGTDGPLTLERYRGKVVYLDFWASWCAPCQKSFPWMNRLQKEYAASGLQVLAVNLDAKREDANAFLARVPAQFALAFDATGASARAYTIKGMPSSVLIGRDGRLLWRHTGFNEADKAEIEAQIKAALQTKEGDAK